MRQTPPFLQPAFDGRNDAPLARPLPLEGGPKHPLHFRLSRDVCGQLAGGFSGADPLIGGFFRITYPQF
jgi:hypothetical protein